MMGRLNHDQEQFFYSFRLDEAVPDDHPVRGIASVLDLSWVHAELAPFYPRTGRPSIDPELMIRLLIIGYVFAIRSERALCRDVRVNLAYRWFCGLSIEDKVPDHSAFSRAVMSVFARATCSGGFLNAWLRLALRPGWSAGKASRWMRA
jgi:transposase